MSLVRIWEKQPDIVLKYPVKQVLAMAGDGQLRDGNKCSEEFRTFLSLVPTSYLTTAARSCLEASFTDSGLVLQDIISEIGTRLEFQVERGPYRGNRAKTGFDACWKAPGCRDMVLEVKTTDYITLPLTKLFEYKRALVKAAKIRENACVLVVLGREDAGSLADQVNGSRHAWDTRLISVEALIKLLRVKELADQESTIAQIRALLQPIETTKLDEIIDIVFSTARDVEDTTESQATETTAGSEIREKSKQKRTPNEQIDAKRQLAAASFGRKNGLQFTKHRRTLYKSTHDDVRLCVVVSKRLEDHGHADPQFYWYVYHPRWDDFLKKGRTAYVVLSCIDRDSAFAIPYKDFAAILPHLGKTKTEDREFWHIPVVRQENEELAIRLASGKGNFALKPHEYQGLQQAGGS